MIGICLEDIAEIDKMEELIKFTRHDNREH